jgi:hypothetical protein
MLLANGASRGSHALHREIEISGLKKRMRHYHSIAIAVLKFGFNRETR